MSFFENGISSERQGAHLDQGKEAEWRNPEINKKPIDKVGNWW